jgi:hypothetical protein
MTMPSATPVNVVPRKRKRTEPATPRSTLRDERRDAVMRMVFSKNGFAADIARHLETTHQNVSQWNRVPAHHVTEVADLLNMTPEQIRPDIFKRKRRP